MAEGISSSLISPSSFSSKQVAVGTAQTVAGTTASATYADPTNQPSLTFTASVSGQYMVLYQGIWAIGAAATAGARLNASVGSPTSVFSQEAALVAAAASESVACIAYRIDTLVAGTSYTYTVQGKVSGAVTLTFANNLPTNGSAIVAIQLQ